MAQHQQTAQQSNSPHLETATQGKFPNTLVLVSQNKRADFGRFSKSIGRMKIISTEHVSQTHHFCFAEQNCKHKAQPVQGGWVSQNHNVLILLIKLSQPNTIV